MFLAIPRGQPTRGQIQRVADIIVNVVPSDFDMVTGSPREFKLADLRSMEHPATKAGDL
jgi:hypothetical protein